MVQDQAQEAAADKKISKVNSYLCKQLTLYSKLYGPDPNMNPALAAAITNAKKAGVQKAKMEAAIARGQGRSTEGATLQSFTHEAILPPSIALIIEAEGDNTNRIRADLDLIVRKGKATVSGSKFYFSRLGRVVFEKTEAIGVDEVMDQAIEAGAEDLDTDDEGNIVIWTQPTQTTQIMQAVGDAHKLKVLSADIMWVPNEETKTVLDSGKDLQTFTELVEALRENSDVQAIYANVSRGNVSDEEWAALEDNLDV